MLVVNFVPSVPHKKENSSPCNKEGKAPDVLYIVHLFETGRCPPQPLLTWLAGLVASR